MKKLDREAEKIMIERFGKDTVLLQNPVLVKSSFLEHLISGTIILY